MFAADREAGYGHASQRRLAAVRVNAINKEEIFNAVFPTWGPTHSWHVQDCKSSSRRRTHNTRTAWRWRLYLYFPSINDCDPVCAQATVGMFVYILRWGEKALKDSCLTENNPILYMVSVYSFSIHASV